MSPAVEVQSLNHRTAREVPVHFFKIRFFVVVDLLEFFIYSGYQSLTRYVVSNIFFHSVGGLFTLSMVSCDAQQCLILMKSSLSILSFVACAFGVTSKKSLPNPVSWGFSLTFSYKSFIVLALLFGSLLQFELNFLYLIRVQFFFFFGMWISSFPQYHCWKDYPFSVEWSWYPCWKSFAHICKYSYWFYRWGDWYWDVTDR